MVDFSRILQEVCLSALDTFKLLSVRAVVISSHDIKAPTLLPFEEDFTASLPEEQNGYVLCQISTTGLELQTAVSALCINV